MIIYNLRKNGPYEYDKFMLNIGQIHNNIKKISKEYENHEIHQKSKLLDFEIKTITNQNSLLNQLLLITAKTRRNDNAY